MSMPGSFWNSLRSFIIQYPAVLSGYVIYSYLFLCILRFFLLVEAGEATILRVYETFVAVPFLWLLALSLVKVIEIRTRLHDSQTKTLKAHAELETKHVQLTTLHEVIRGVQDRVNNPLEVISMNAEELEAAGDQDGRVREAVHAIKDASRQISGALAEFNRVEEYMVRDVGGGLGSFVVTADPHGTGTA